MKKLSILFFSSVLIITLAASAGIGSESAPSNDNYEAVIFL